MREQKPGVGRVVHYISLGTPIRSDGTQQYEAECRAATITEVMWGEEVGLCVMNPTGLFFPRAIPHDEAQESTGSWHWAQPCLEKSEFQLKAEDLRVEVMRAAAPGQMARVTVTHLPTGLRAPADRRSVIEAKAAALDKLTYLVQVHERENR